MKRLIYPTQYFSDIVGDKVLGLFAGIDVRTDEEIYGSTIQEETEDLELADFFKENDVLYMEYGRTGNFSIARIANRKLSYEEIKRDYLRFKNKNLSEEEINDQMIEKFNNKIVKTKRMYKK